MGDEVHGVALQSSYSTQRSHEDDRVIASSMLHFQNRIPSGAGVLVSPFTYLDSGRLDNDLGSRSKHAATLISLLSSSSIFTLSGLAAPWSLGIDALGDLSGIKGRSEGSMNRS